MSSDVQQLQDRSVAWFSEQPDESHISPAAQKLLETYSNVPSEEVVAHVVRVRDEAWKIFPYPCIGQFRFLDLSLSQRADYGDILQRIKNGERFLDMACCFGQEIRQLVADGAPAENLYGCDLRGEFLDLGYKLFLDKNKLSTRFVTANVFDATSALTELKGQLDIIYVGSFFHLWGYKDQVTVSKAVASLLRPRKGTIIVGRQVGAVSPAEHDHRTNPTGTMFRHNVESLTQQWKEIGDDLGVSFTVDAELELLAANHNFHTNDTRRILFKITRG
ncbi:hypothetical protein B0J11DRAFT_72676 [Dendryphion nanum]|uniref:Methyltransferase domain-containing protein n=1 Tax=Dendryphion nanum TaxID=256645 RepID=A0A9P9DJ65_9PLEO|nr:hypothetical protein B0J11DRAFT_72676 [Dendryphion nanum]